MSDTEPRRGAVSIAWKCAMSEAACSHCGAGAPVKAGRPRSGTQRWQCRACGRATTLERKQHGYSAETREWGGRRYLEGTSLRGTGRVLGVVQQSVANWVAAAERMRPEQVAALMPTDTGAVDELETYVGKQRR